MVSALYFPMTFSEASGFPLIHFPFNTAIMDDFLQDFWTYHMYTDSWIEVASQPSSSSLSSANDDIITDGLRVQHDSNAPRRRQQRTSRLHLDLGLRRSMSTGTSSQEEYDESESESDRVLSSSNEALPRLPETRRTSRVQYSSSSDGGEEDDEDENLTAVGYIRSDDQTFTPQPNAFTHPPSAPANRPSQHQTSYFQARPATRTSTQRHSYPSQQASHSPYNMIAPSHQVDHDAALRASLSTLLSCAAAARGLPKSNAQPSTRAAAAAAAVPSSSRVDPTTLRMVPESALPSSSPSPPAPTTTTATTKPSIRTTTASARSTSAEEKYKRRRSRDRRGSTKKARRAMPTAAPPTSSTSALDDSSLMPPTVSPTLLTWVVSAGVVVLVSALSFSAGYVVGRETGRAELELLGGVNASGGNVVGSCAGEVVGRGGLVGAGGGGGTLRRLRFADAVRVS